MAGQRKFGISRAAWGIALRWGTAFGAIFFVLVPVFYDLRPRPDWGWLISPRLRIPLLVLVLGVVLLAWIEDRFGDRKTDLEG